MRKNPDRVAWAVLLACFSVFCGLAAGIPLTIRSFLVNATNAPKARMQVIEGTVLLQKASGGEPIGVTASKPAELSRGDEVITDQGSWAIVELFDRSNVILYGNAKARLAEVQTPRFRASDHPNRITLDLTGGVVRVGVAMPRDRSTEFLVNTPHTLIALQEGSYRIEVDNDRTQLTVERGQAVVGRAGIRQAIPQGKRTSVDLSGAQSEEQPAAENLIQNGDFQQPLATGWVSNTVAYDRSVQAPSVEATEEEGRQAVRFWRRASDDGHHTEISIAQELNKQVRDRTRVEISLDLRLKFQSLSGGGQLSSEFPVQIRLDYKDQYGNDNFWTHGFYYQNTTGYPIWSDAWGRPIGEEIPVDVWYPFESGNLLELLGDSQPVQLTSLKIYASGWNYESLVSEVQLIVE